MDDEITLRETVSKRRAKVWIDEINEIKEVKICGWMMAFLILFRKISNRTKTDSGTWAEHAKASGE